MGVKIIAVEGRDAKKKSKLIDKINKNNNLSSFKGRAGKLKPRKNEGSEKKVNKRMDKGFAKAAKLQSKVSKINKKSTSASLSGASMNVPVDVKVNGNPVGNEEQNNDGASFIQNLLPAAGILSALKKRNQGKSGEDLRNRKAKKRADRKKYGWGKKGAAAKKAAITKKAADVKLAALGADDGSTGTDGKGPTISSVGDKAVGDLGASMNNINMSVPAKKIMSIQKMSQGTRPKYDNVQGSSMYEKNKMGASMYRKNMDGSSMNAYQDKEASMDDYSHEKKLKADGRYEAAKGDMSNAKNDFDHAHALKNDAKHDAKGRHSIMKHMRGFK